MDYPLFLSPAILAPAQPPSKLSDTNSTLPAMLPSPAPSGADSSLAAPAMPPSPDLIEAAVIPTQYVAVTLSDSAPSAFGPHVPLSVLLPARAHIDVTVSEAPSPAPVDLSLATTFSAASSSHVGRSIALDAQARALRMVARNAAVRHSNGNNPSLVRTSVPESFAAGLLLAGLRTPIPEDDPDAALSQLSNLVRLRSGIPPPQGTALADAAYRAPAPAAPGSAAYAHAPLSALPRTAAAVSRTPHRELVGIGLLGPSGAMSSSRSTALDARSRDFNDLLAGIVAQRALLRPLPQATNTPARKSKGTTALLAVATTQVHPIHSRASPESGCSNDSGGGWILPTFPKEVTGVQCTRGTSVRDPQKSAVLQFCRFRSGCHRHASPSHWRLRSSFALSRFAVQPSVCWPVTPRACFCS